MQTTGQAAVTDNSTSDAFSGAAGEIKGLLQAVAERIADAERRQAQALGQMQERLANLGHEARGVRARVPSEFSAAFERIEEGMSLLATRIAATSEPSYFAPQPPANAASAAPMALRSALGSVAAAQPHAAPGAIDTFDVVDSGAEPHGWDAASADALTRVYETSDAGLGRPAYDPDVKQDATPPHFPAAIERDWLDQRLSDVAKRIEGSFAGSRSDSSLAQLGARFDQLENRFAAALENVATRSDVDGLRLVEAHINELAQQFEQAQGHFLRLDGIERQLMGLADRLSDQRLASIVGRSPEWPNIEQMITSATERVVAEAQHFASAQPQPQQLQQPDFEELVRAAADHAVQRFAGMAQPAAAGGSDTERHFADIRQLVEAMAAERRQGDETTASMLDTMQQAMIRLLDRIDAIEMGGLHASPPPAFGYSGLAHGEPAARFVAEPDLGGVSLSAPQPMHADTRSDFRSEPHPDPVHEPRLLPASEFRAEVARSELHNSEPAIAPEPPRAAVVAEPSHDGELLRIEPILGPVSEQMKQEFVAAARRARRNVAGQPALKTMPVAPPAAPRVAKPAAAPSVSTPAAKEADAGRQAKAAGSAASALSFLNIPRKLFLGGTTAVLAVIIAALLMPRAHEMANVLLQQAPSAADSSLAATSTQRSDRIAALAPAVSAGEHAPTMPETALDDLSASVRSEGNAVADAGSTSPAADAAGAPKGIMLQQNETPLTPEDLARISRQQQMANISTELGAAAGATAQPRAEPTALPSTQSLAAPAPGNAGNPSGARSALDLPPATVGPLSLRLAAAKGDPSAEFEVGARLAEGKGTAQNFAEAAKWYQRSAQQGFAQAQYRLGTLLERGLGQKADLQRARVWYKRAAEQGNVKAMHNLAVLSAGRQANAPDYAAAAQWFTEAAQRGLTDSQFNLAVLYESGLGVPKDLKQAYKWFALSARSGDKESQKRRDQIRGQLAASDLQAAEAGARDWVATPQDQMSNDARAAGEAWKARASGDDNG